MSTVLVGAMVVGLAIWAGRAAWKEHKTGGCGGNCSHCRSCGKH
ncbi:MAG: FeoB-associated Cys-rich membrane protein [Eubacteriales bacterium]